MLLFYVGARARVCVVVVLSRSNQNTYTFSQLLVSINIEQVKQAFQLFVDMRATKINTNHFHKYNNYHFGNTFATNHDVVADSARASTYRPGSFSIAWICRCLAGRATRCVADGHVFCLPSGRHPSLQKLVDRWLKIWTYSVWLLHISTKNQSSSNYFANLKEV